MSFSDPLSPVYGWAMKFSTGSPYVTQSNIIGGPKSPLGAQEFSQQCPIQQRDGRYSSSPPYYSLGPVPFVNCPYYNYILPDAYPYEDPLTVPAPNPKQYWYYPYYKDPTFWDHSIVRVPKPG